MKEGSFLNQLYQILIKKPLVVLLILFCLSVLIRLPNLDRPLSKHHELNAALVLINSEEWNRKGPSTYNYLPVHSYHNPGDKIFDVPGNLTHGQQLNLTVPPLWYILPHGFFHLVGADPYPMLLQVFNLLLHLICLILIYRIALLLFKKDEQTTLKAVTTCFIYLFSPTPLWFHGNGYVHEVAVLPFVFSACLLYLKIIDKQRGTVLHYLLFSLMILAGILTDWLMCFVAAAICITSIFLWKRERKRWQLTIATLTGVSVLIGLFIIVVQASSFIGFENYVKALIDKFLSRSITGDVQSGGIASRFGMASHYLIGFGLVIPFIIYACSLKDFKRTFSINGWLKQFIIVGAVTCLLHHVVFWGFTNIHDYSVLKSGLVISLLATVAIFSIKQTSRKLVLLLLISVFDIGIYYFINRLGDYAVNGQPYSYFKTLGEKIKESSKPEDYIFIDTPEMSLILTYYSKRTYKTVKDLDEAEKAFKELPGKTAVFFHIEDFRFISATSLQK